MKKLKFGIWRHENSIGNSAEHTIGLAHYMKANDINPSDVEVYVEHEWQKDFALCIDGINEDNIKFFEKEINYHTLQEKPHINDIYMPINDIHMPSVYGFPLTYDCNWAYIEQQKHLNITLKFDSEAYENRFELPKDAIVLFHREEGTWWKRHDGDLAEPERFVEPEVFHKLAFYYADLGYKVIKIGDKNQIGLAGRYSSSKFGAEHEHPNIIDFTKYVEFSNDVQSMVTMEIIKTNSRPLWTLKDYLYILQNCKAFVSCDAGIWPMAAAMRKNLVFCNVVSTFFPWHTMNSIYPYRDYAETEKKQMERVNPCIVDWMSEKTTKILYKRFDIPQNVSYITDVRIKDNSFEEIREALESFL